MVDRVITPEFRVAFAHVFQPQRPMNEGADPKYGITMLFKHGEDLTKLKQAAQEAVKEKWGDNVPKNLRTPFRDQGERDSMGFEDGAVFINATSKVRPGLVDSTNEEIISPEEFYSGCWARASVRPFTYDVNGNRGVGFGLQNVQKLRDGDPLGGRTKPQDDFEPVDAPVTGDNASGDAGDLFS